MKTHPEILAYCGVPRNGLPERTADHIKATLLIAALSPRGHWVQFRLLHRAMRYAWARRGRN